MRPQLPVVTVAFLTLALSGPALVRAETESERLLNQSTYAVSQDPTQVTEEKAIEKKDGMDAPANPAPSTASGTAGAQEPSGTANSAAKPHK